MEFLKFVLQTVVFFVIAFFFLGDYASGGCFSQDRWASIQNTASCDLSSRDGDMMVCVLCGEQKKSRSKRSGYNILPDVPCFNQDIVYNAGLHDGAALRSWVQ